MNKFFEAMEIERNSVGTVNLSLHDVGYINGLTMAKILALKFGVEPVVRCKDCEYCYKSSFSSTGYRCKMWGSYDTDCETSPDNFCSKGEQVKENYV